MTSTDSQQALEKRFPRGDSQYEAYYRWMAEKGYIDVGKYADGRPEGQIVLTEKGESYLEQLAVREEMFKAGHADRAESERMRRVVLTDEGKRYWQVDEKEGWISLTPDGERLVEQRQREFEEDVHQYAIGVADEFASGMLAAALALSLEESDPRRKIFLEALRENPLVD